LRIYLARCAWGEGFYDSALADDRRRSSVELQTVKALDDAHRMQCTNYLRAAGPQLCLLLDFGKPRLEIKRVAHAYEPRRLICVFCVHRLPISALKFFLDLQPKVGAASRL
jgi:hypothetical protein